MILIYELEEKDIATEDWYSAPVSNILNCLHDCGLKMQVNQINIQKPQLGYIMKALGNAKTIQLFPASIRMNKLRDSYGGIICALHPRRLDYKFQTQLSKCKFIILK